MSKSDLIEFTVVEPGYRDAVRKRPGDTFLAPANLKCSWAVPTSKKDSIPAKTGGKANMVAGELKDIVPKLPSLSKHELNEMLSQEQGGRMRKGLMAAISDELANRIGKEPVKPARQRRKAPEKPADVDPPAADDKADADPLT